MKHKKDRIEHILVICAQGMGNTLLATPTITALRREFPDKRISVLVWKNGSDMVLRGLPEIDSLYIMNAEEPRYKLLITWAKKLRSMKISHCIVAWPGGIFSSLLSLASGAPVRIGHVPDYWLPLPDVFFSNAIRWGHNSRHDLERNLDLARELGVESGLPASLQIRNSQTDIRFSETFIRENLIDNSKLLFGIAPGSGWSQRFKRWPADYFTTLGDKLRAKFNGEVLLFIGPDEENLVDDIVKNMKYPPVVVRSRTIHEVAALMSTCRIIIANDSGLMHLAVASGVPVIAVMGPTNPERTGPYGAECRVVTLGIPCSPCYNHFRLRFKCSRTPLFECLNALEPEIVLSAIYDVIEREETLIV